MRNEIENPQQNLPPYANGLTTTESKSGSKSRTPCTIDLQLMDTSKSLLIIEILIKLSLSTSKFRKPKAFANVNHGSRQAPEFSQQNEA